MKPFTLDTVLNYRQRLEDIAKNELAKALQEEQDMLSLLQEQQDAYDAVHETIERVQHEGVTITELIRHEEHLSYLKNTLADLRSRLEEKQHQVAQARKDLLTKSRERKVMEKLKERQNSAWQHYLNKKEAAILDEIAIMFHNK